MVIQVAGKRSKLFGRVSDFFLGGESGNRQRKLPESTLTALEEFIANDYETLKQAQM